MAKLGLSPVNVFLSKTAPPELGGTEELQSAEETKREHVKCGIIADGAL